MRLLDARLLPLVFLAALFGCGGPSGGPGGAPQITSFIATPQTISAPGQAVTLSWEITGGVTSLEIDQSVGPVAGSSTIVNPTATTTYTLTASNSSGSNSQSTTVTFGTGGGELVEDGLPPTLTTFGVSLTQTDFQNDQTGNIESPSDPRIVQLQPGGTFYAVVSATDPGGIAGVTVFLANSSPPGLRNDLVLGQPVGGFTLTGEVGGCILDGTQTAVTCIYEIAVGNIPNIDELAGAGSEFAYVFRTRVTDNAGLVSDTPPRGYVIVDDGGTPPPVDPGPPANRGPNADFTFQQQEDTLAVAFSGARSSDPDGDSLSYRWNFGDGSNATARDFRKTYSEADSYQVSLTVTDPDGASDTETKTVTVLPVGGGGDDTYTLTVQKAGSGNGTVTSSPSGINCGDDCTQAYDSDTQVTLTATAASSSTFAGWGGACSGSGTCQVTMSQARSVTATFNTTSTPPTDYELTIDFQGTGGGEVLVQELVPQALENCTDDCTQNIPAGTMLQLQAVAGETSLFSDWTGCDSANADICVLEMDGDKTVSVTFDALPVQQYILKVAPTFLNFSSGKVTSSPGGINCGDDCTQAYDSGTQVTLMATAASGSTFAGWGGACSGSGTCQVTMSQARNVTATFNATSTTPTNYELTIEFQGAGGGEVLVQELIPLALENCTDDCTQNIPAGTVLSLQAVAGETSLFSDWTGCDSTNADICLLEMDGDQTVSVTFDALPVQQYTLKVAPTFLNFSSGKVTSSPAGIDCGIGGNTCSFPFDEGRTVTLIATSAAGSILLEWSGDCAGKERTCALSMNGNKVVYATFGVVPY